MSFNLHIYPSTFRHESRILKITESITRTDFFEKILIAALPDDGLPEKEILDQFREVQRVPLSTFGLSGGKIRGALRYIQWMATILIKYRKADIWMINCHSIVDLPIGYFLKLINNHIEYLIYDTHELETETKDLHRLFKRLAKFVERWCMKKVDQVFVVSESIAKWYRTTYDIERVTTVRNVPDIKRGQLETLSNSTKLRDLLNLEPKTLIFIYQGHLSHGRGIPLLLEVFSNIDDEKHLVFMGYGPMESTIKEAGSRVSNIHFVEAVRPAEVLQYTSSADVGISLIENTCLSYYYCLPNKIYEYFLSGIPSIVSNFPEMAAFIDETGAGWTSEVDVLTLINLVNSIDRDTINRKKNHIANLNFPIGWHIEEEKLIDRYKELLNTQKKFIK